MQHPGYFRTKWLVAIAFCFLAGLADAQTPDHLYRAGEEGYACYRIPSLITTRKGTVLAFCEARKNGCGDAGDIDLVVKRSHDGGKTWSALQVVWSDSTNTCGNPAPVVDGRSGRIVLLSTWNLGTDSEKMIENGTSKDTRRVFVLQSSDDGNSWSAPREVTASVKKPGWDWYATGPGRGIQITRGKFRGRMVVSCNFKEKETHKNFSHAIYSDDRGEHWTLGGITPRDSVNESTLAELSDGRLLLNMRNASSKRQRQVSISADGGESWSEPRPDTVLTEPVCQGSLIAYPRGKKGWELAFSNPASTTSRSRITVKVSSDDGQTWPRQKLVYEGPSAYSCLTLLPNGHLGLLYEAGVAKAYEGIAFIELDPEAFVP